MKDLSTVRTEKNVKSGFLAIGMSEKANAPIAEFAVVSGAMAAGITGTVLDIDYREITGGPGQFLTGDQILQTANGPV